MTKAGKLAVMFHVPAGSFLRNSEVREAIIAFVVAWGVVCLGLTWWVTHNFPNSL